MYHQISPSNVIVKYHSTSSGRNMVKHTYTHTHILFPFFLHFFLPFRLPFFAFFAAFGFGCALGCGGALGSLGFGSGGGWRQCPGRFQQIKINFRRTETLIKTVHLSMDMNSTSSAWNWLPRIPQSINNDFPCPIKTSTRGVLSWSKGLLVAAPRPGERCSWNRLNHSEASQATNG